MRDLWTGSLDTFSWPFWSSSNISALATIRRVGDCGGCLPLLQGGFMPISKAFAFGICLDVVVMLDPASPRTTPAFPSSLSSSPGPDDGLMPGLATKLSFLWAKWFEEAAWWWSEGEIADYAMNFRHLAQRVMCLLKYFPTTRGTKSTR